jgi:hypothetical protein
MPTNEGPLSVTTGAAISAHRRVISNGSTVSHASGSQSHDGVCNTAAASGAVTAMDPSNASGTFWIEAVDAITAGNLCYAAADGMVGSTGTILVGRALNTVTANQIVEVLPFGQFGAGAYLLYSNTAVSADHENTTTEAIFDKSYTLPANSLKAGDVIRIRASVLVTDNNSTDTLTLVLRIGGLAGTAIATTAAVDVADNDVGYIDADVVVRTIGASGTASGHGVQALGVPGTVTAKPFHKASFTLDTTATQVICVSADWSVASADNEANLENFVIELLRTAA